MVEDIEAIAAKLRAAAESTKPWLNQSIALFREQVSPANVLALIEAYEGAKTRLEDSDAGGAKLLQATNDACALLRSERDEARRHLGFSEAMLIGLLNKARIGLTDAGEFIANELEVREGSFLGRDGNPDDPDTAVYITEARETQSSVNAALAEIEAALDPETAKPAASP